jgi:hypothetical protein
LSHLSHREFLIWKERGGKSGGWAFRWAGQQAGRSKVRLGLGEIEREGRDRDTEIQRDR